MFLKQEQYIRNLIREELDNLRYKMAGYGHDEKEVKYNTVYHTTSFDNAKKILSYGFIKSRPSSDEPEAIFLTPDLYGAVLLTKNLSKVKGLKTDWVILKIDSSNIILFKDPYSIKESGVYTYDGIPKELISVKTIIDKDIIKNQHNWKSFWNWWFWNKGEKPLFVKKFNLGQYKF
jgi:hypothetical protein